ncbi:NACHT domain-containing protein [Trichoderma barbatum]
MANVREISGNTIGNNATIVQGDLNTFNANKDKSLLEKTNLLLNQISQTDPYYDKKRILELKGPFLHESFNWILDHEGFEKWRCTRKSGVLWIKGDPGKGKTMLLCGIIDDFEQNPGINANLAYFFCQATDSRINTATSVVAGLISPLVKRLQKIFSQTHQEFRERVDQHQGPPHIRQEYTEKAKEARLLLSSIDSKYGQQMGHLNGPNGWNILCDIFEDVTLSSALSDPVCIVDALDECEHNCKSLLNLIVKTSGHVKWLLSSRNVKDIERGFRAIEPSRRLSLELKENAANVSKSVDVYVNHCVTDVDALENDEELRIKTTAILKEKASGTFLWVALVIEQLRGTDRRNVEDVLEEIPEGLENLYDLIIRRANSKLRQKDQEACRILLSIVTTAERPLLLEELHVYISSQCEDYKATYDIRDITDIVKDFGSLLSIRDNTVYFIHQNPTPALQNG